jgi:putative ABC transport system permease protein
VATIPNVASASASSNLPGALRFNFAAEIHIEGKPAISPATAPMVDFKFVGPRYFQTLNIPLRSGRAISEQDGERTPLVAVVSARLAERYFPGESPIGKKIRFDGVTPAGWRTIVGIAGDVHQFWFEKDSRPLLYLPYRQAPRRAMFIAMRSQGHPVAMLAAARERVHRLDATLPIHDVKLMGDVVEETMGAMRLVAGIMTVFGIVALVLAAVGVYGVMAYSVAQRQREFGIRMALGARPQAVLQMVLRQGFVLAAWGISLGLAGGFALSRVMSGVMFGVESNSAVVVLVLPLVLALVALAACWIPARTATLADPMRALRQE